MLDEGRQRAGVAMHHYVYINLGFDIVFSLYMCLYCIVRVERQVLLLRSLITVATSSVASAPWRVVLCGLVVHSSEWIASVLFKHKSMAVDV